MAKCYEVKEFDYVVFDGENFDEIAAFARHHREKLWVPVGFLMQGKEMSVAKAELDAGDILMHADGDFHACSPREFVEKRISSGPAFDAIEAELARRGAQSDKGKEQ
jgi:hypothetical protein